MERAKGGRRHSGASKEEEGGEAEGDLCTLRNSSLFCWDPTSYACMVLLFASFSAMISLSSARVRRGPVRRFLMVSSGSWYCVVVVVYAERSQEGVCEGGRRCAELRGNKRLGNVYNQIQIYIYINSMPKIIIGQTDTIQKISS